MRQLTSLCSWIFITRCIGSNPIAIVPTDLTCDYKVLVENCFTVT